MTVQQTIDLTQADKIDFIPADMHTRFYSYPWTFRVLFLRTVETAKFLIHFENGKRKNNCKKLNCVPRRMRKSEK